MLERFVDLDAYAAFPKTIQKCVLLNKDHANEDELLRVRWRKLLTTSKRAICC